MHWIGGAGNFSDATSWDTGSAPGIEDNAFNNSGYAVQLDGGVSVGQLVAGGAPGASGSYVQDGWFVSVDTDFVLGDAANAHGTYTLNDGSFEVWRDVRIGDKGEGVFVQNGGSAIVYASVVNLGNNGGSGVYELNAGSADYLTLTLGASSDSSGVLKLNGGVFSGGLVKGAGTAAIHFNGGTLKATAANYFASFSAADLILQDGGLIFDTGSLASVNLRKGFSGNGSLTKIGSGELVIASENAMTGEIIIAEGSLSVFSSMFPFAGYSGSLSNVESILVKAGARFSLSSVGVLDIFNDDGNIVLEAGAELQVVGVAESIGALIVNGHVLDLGTYTIAELNALNYGVSFLGSGTLTVTAIPEPSSYAFALVLAAGLVGTMSLHRRARKGA